MHYFIGIDPGKNGGISLLPEDLAQPVQAWPMPKTPTDLWQFCHRLHFELSTAKHTWYTLREEVHSMPHDAGKAAMTFGKWIGYIELGIIAAGLTPMDTVRPEVWMKAMCCMSKGDKNITKSKAQELFPSLTITHATADALLIGAYARKMLKIGSVSPSVSTT